MDSTTPALVNVPETVTTLPSPFHKQDSVYTSLDHPYSLWYAPKFTGFIENIAVYIAGFVVRKAIRKIECNTCRQSLVSSYDHENHSHMYHLLSLRNQGGLVIPSQGTVTVVMGAERALRRRMNVLTARPCPKQEVLTIVKTEYGLCDPFALGSHIRDTQHGVDNHYFDLLDVVVTIYYSLRQRHIARLHTQRAKGRTVRQKYTKLILFKGD